MPSFSARTIVYKGLLLAPQIAHFYPELSDPEVVSALCLVHQRFSTNTFPTWQLAHPFRYVAHNGEINTLRGNVNWMQARQSVLASPLFGDEMKKLFPIIQPGGSDSASFDNALELLVMSGRGIAARHGDADSRSVVAQRAHGSAEARVLRIPRLADGAVGRPGGDGVHRRPLDRGHARPQRAASGAVSGDQRRPDRHGVGDRGAAGRAGEREIQGAAATRQDAAGGHGGRAHRLGQGVEAQPLQPQSVPALVEGKPDHARQPGRSAAPARNRRANPAAAPARLRIHRRGHPHGHGAHGGAGRGAGGLDGRRYAAGVPVGQAAAAVQLLQAALRAGDQSAHRSRSAKRW